MLWKPDFGRRRHGVNGVTVRLRRASARVLQQETDGHADEACSVTFSREGRWLATSGEDQTINLLGLEVDPTAKTQ
jgi:WD40 repeat protein